MLIVTYFPASIIAAELFPDTERTSTTVVLNEIALGK